MASMVPVAVRLSLFLDKGLVPVMIQEKKNCKTNNC